MDYSASSHAGYPLIQPSVAPDTGDYIDGVDPVTFEIRKVHLVVFVQDRSPEVVSVELDFPAAVTEAMEQMCYALDHHTVRRYGHMLPVQPQPAYTYASFVARPPWATTKVQILVDARAWDGRLFTVVIDRWLQWGSFMLQGGFIVTGVPQIYVRDAPVPTGRPLTFGDGDLVTVLPSQHNLPPRMPLDRMLARAFLWERDAPIFPVPARPTFFVLTDGMPVLISADRIPLSALEAEFRAFLPEEHEVCIHGGVPIAHAGTTYLDVVSRSVLTVEFVPSTFTEPSSSSSSEDSSQEHGSSHDSPSPPGDRSVAATTVGEPTVPLVGGLFAIRYGLSAFVAAGVGLACKLLVEPTSSGPAARLALATLRHLAAGMGEHWRYAPAEDAVYLSEDTLSEADSAEQSAPCQVSFGVLVVDCAPEEVSLELYLPATVDETMRALQALYC
ncbi:unnamed protein product [Symbiodinium sp. CCMP2592]|nr:unnamed protein product [Symbiodinium sp. CCMP2592]